MWAIGTPPSEAFQKAKAEHGAIDVLVNNAGITRDRMFLQDDAATIGMR
jgi:NAD(P)-dependent dehydrogenase (short-subunit alcohol dehydrogenase family)